METTKLSDSEIHARAMQRLDAMTREEWQERLDKVARVFGPEDATSAKREHSTPRLKTSKASKKLPRKTAAKVAAG